MHTYNSKQSQERKCNFLNRNYAVFSEWVAAAKLQLSNFSATLWLEEVMFNEMMMIMS